MPSADHTIKPYNKNPFNFKHYDAKFIVLYVGGTQYPAKPSSLYFNPVMWSVNTLI